MDIVTCQEMKDIERLADEKGLPYLQMMENAGTEVFKIILNKTEPTDRTANVYCGKGNNGGDGFVIARLLEKEGWNVNVILVDGEPKTNDAILNYGRLENVTITDNPEEAAIVVDAIYGTGFHGTFRDSASKYVDEINSSGATVFAVDIPSGLNGDMTDEDLIENEPVKADLTISFHRLKPVHICEKAKPYLGEVIVADIEIDNYI